MSLPIFRQAVVDWVIANIEPLEDVIPYDGKVDIDEMMHVSVKTPSVLVSVMASDQDGDESDYDVVGIAIFIVGRDLVNPKRSRGEVTLTIASELHRLLRGADFGYVDLREGPYKIRSRNLYDLKSQKNNTIIWGVSFQCILDLQPFDLTTLPDLNTVYADATPASIDAIAAQHKADTIFDPVPYPFVDNFDGPEWEVIPPHGWDIFFGSGPLPAIEIIDLQIDPENLDAAKALKIRLQELNQPTAMFPLKMRDLPIIKSTNKIWLTSNKDPASYLSCGLIIRGYQSGEFYLYLLTLEGAGIQKISLIRLDSLGFTTLHDSIIDAIPGNPDPVIKNGDIVGLQVDTYDDPAGPGFEIRYSLDLGQTWVKNTVVDDSRPDLLGQAATSGIFSVGNIISPGDEFTIGGYKVISNEV